MVNLFPREVPRVLNLFPRELIESTPKNFPNANPKLHQRPDPWPKTRGAALYNALQWPVWASFTHGAGTGVQAGVGIGVMVAR